MEKENILKLKHQACFPLYALSREIMNVYRPFLDELEITYPQYLVFMVLWEHEPQSVNQIGEKLHLDSGTLTPLLKRLESKKFIERTRKICDERVVEITLTDKGRNLKTEASKIPDKVIDNLGITEEELQQLKLLTNKILKKIN